jgi:hypothetical protein
LGDAAFSKVPFSKKGIEENNIFIMTLQSPKCHLDKYHYDECLAPECHSVEYHFAVEYSAE